MLRERLKVLQKNRIKATMKCPVCKTELKKILPHAYVCPKCDMEYYDRGDGKPITRKEWFEHAEEFNS